AEEAPGETGGQGEETQLSRRRLRARQRPASALRADRQAGGLPAREDAVGDCGPHGGPKPRAVVARDGLAPEGAFNHLTTGGHVTERQRTLVLPLVTFEDGGVRRQLAVENHHVD